MKILALCLLAASAVPVYGQFVGPIGEVYLMQHPAETFLPDDWVKEAQQMMVLTAAVQVRDGRIIGAKELIESKTALVAKTKTVGEAVVMAGLSHYADDVFARLVIGAKLEVSKGMETVLQDPAACRSLLTKVTEVGKTPPRLAACEPVKQTRDVPTPDEAKAMQQLGIAGQAAASPAHGETSAEATLPRRIPPPDPPPTQGGATQMVGKRLFVVDTVTQVAKTNVYDAGIFGTSATTTSGEGHSATAAVAELMKKCPSTIVITYDQRTANYLLSPALKASTLVHAASDVHYVSPAVKLSNMAKDVCTYLETH